MESHMRMITEKTPAIPMPIIGKVDTKAAKSKLKFIFYIPFLDQPTRLKIMPPAITDAI